MRVQFRRSNAPRLDAANARRQGDITRLAFERLGRDQAIVFLNTDHAELGGRPLDLATGSEEGRASVAAELDRLTGPRGSAG